MIDLNIKYRMNSVFYNGLLNECIDATSKRDGLSLPHLELFKNNAGITFFKEESSDDTFLITYEYFHYLDKIFIQGSFIIERSSGIIIKEIGISDIPISFHEMMSNFFEFEILSLYQIIHRKLDLIQI